MSFIIIKEQGTGDISDPIKKYYYQGSDAIISFSKNPNYIREYKYAKTAKRIASQFYQYNNGVPAVIKVTSTEDKPKNVWMLYQNRWWKKE